MLRTKLALMTALVVLAAFGAYVAASHGVRAQSPGPASQGPFTVEDAQLVLPPEAAARMQGQQPLAPKSPYEEEENVQRERPKTVDAGSAIGMRPGARRSDQLWSDRSATARTDEGGRDRSTATDQAT